MSFSTYKGYYVFDKYPSWKIKKPDESLTHIVEESGDIGFKYAYTYQEYCFEKLSYGFVFNGREKIYQINNLFDNCKGRKINIWFPSWRDDLTLTAGIGKTDTLISIEDCFYNTSWPASPGSGRYLFFYVSPTQWYARKVVDVPSSTWLELESAIGVDLSTNQIKHTCFLYLGRFDQDEIVWNYVSPDLAEVDLFFIETPNEYEDLT